MMSTAVSMTTSCRRTTLHHCVAAGESSARGSPLSSFPRMSNAVQCPTLASTTRVSSPPSHDVRRPRAPHVNPRVDKANDLREVLTASPIRTDFASLGLPPLLDKQSEVERSKLRGKRGFLGKPEFPKEDFHWLLSAMRMTTGEAPQVASKRILQSKIITGQLLFHRDKLRDGTGQVAAPAVIGSGGWQGFKSVFAGNNGVIYAVDQNGRLLIYRDGTQDGTGDVANPAVPDLNGCRISNPSSPATTELSMPLIKTADYSFTRTGHRTGSARLRVLPSSERVAGKTSRQSSPVVTE